MILYLTVFSSLRIFVPWTGCGLSLSAGRRAFTFESVPSTVTGVNTLWIDMFILSKFSLKAITLLNSVDSSAQHSHFLSKMLFMSKWSFEF